MAAKKTSTERRNDLLDYVFFNGRVGLVSEQEKADARWLAARGHARIGVESVTAPAQAALLRRDNCRLSPDGTTMTYDVLWIEADV